MFSRLFLCSRGVVRVDVNLQDVDIDQCAPDGWFGGTHRCNLTTMEVSPHYGFSSTLVVEHLPANQEVPGSNPPPLPCMVLRIKASAEYLHFYTKTVRKCKDCHHTDLCVPCPVIRTLKDCEWGVTVFVASHSPCHVTHVCP